MESNRKILNFSKLSWTQIKHHWATGSINYINRVIDNTSDPSYCTLISVGCNDRDTKTPEEVEIEMSDLICKII